MVNQITFLFREHDRSLIDHRQPVKIDRFDWEFVPTEDACDAWDYGFARALRAYAKAGAYLHPGISQSQFRQAYIYVSSKSGIETAKQLEAGASASCIGTTPPACGRAGRCSIITTSI
jgi:hypothetical protein